MGESTPQTTQQSSVSSPWTPAQPMLQDLLAKYGSMSTATTPEQQAAATSLTNGTSGIPNLGSGASGAVNKAFDFSTLPQVGMLGDAYSSLKGNLAGDASGANLDPWSTPGFSDAMGLLNKNITNQVGNSYAAAGRSPSGAGTMPETLARGLSEGEGTLLQNQFNTNKQNMINANSTTFNAGNTAAGGEANLGMLPITTGLSGVQAAPGAATAYSAPGATALSAANASYMSPWTNLAAALTPAATIGSLGGQSSGTSTTTPANNPLSNIIGGASSGIGMLSMLMSDIRAKTDIAPVGKLNDGQTIHRFRYKGKPEMHIGLLAQHVAKVKPRAVGHMSMGMLGVDYEKATDDSVGMKEAA